MLYPVGMSFQPIAQDPAGASSVPDFRVLLARSNRAFSELTAALRSVPQAGLKTWADGHLDLIGEMLESGVTDPWFILPVLHGTTQLTNHSELDADATRWFARKAGFTLKDTHAFTRTARWLYQPSLWPLDEAVREELSLGKRTQLQRQQQALMRRTLASHQVSLRGIQQLTHCVSFLRDEVKHLGPTFIHEALEAFGPRPDLHALHMHVAARVRETNLALNKDPIPESFNQVRFGATDLNGMMSIMVRCNAELGHGIKDSLTRYVEEYPNRINRRVNRHAQAFQALHQLVTNRGNGAGGGAAGTDVGVVLTLRDYERVCADSGRRVSTTLGTSQVWDQIQRGRVCPIDWIMLLGEEGVTVKQSHPGRFATGQQRAFMAAAAPFCAYPGCTMRAGDSQAHHVVPVHEGGQTSLDNLAFLCEFHHPLNDDSRQRPGGFHVELDAFRVPFILRHEPGARPEYNELNREHSAILRAYGEVRAPDPPDPPSSGP